MLQYMVFFQGSRISPDRASQGYIVSPKNLGVYFKNISVRYHSTVSQYHSHLLLLLLLLRLSFYSVAVVLTLVETKQIRINIHKRNSTKTQYKQYKTQ
jgi:hypothetical protein